MCEALEKAVAAINKEQPEQILAGIPTEKLKTIPNEICGLLVNNGLSFQQAELSLDLQEIFWMTVLGLGLFAGGCYLGGYIE